MKKARKNNSKLVKIYSFKNGSIILVNTRNVSENEYISKKTIIKKHLHIISEKLTTFIFRVCLFLPDIGPIKNVAEVNAYAKIYIYSQDNIKLLKNNLFVITDNTSLESLTEKFYYTKQDLCNIYCRKKISYPLKLILSLNVVFSLIAVYYATMNIVRS